MNDAFERTVDLVAAHGKEVLTRLLRHGGTIGDLFVEERVARSVSHRIRQGRPVDHCTTMCDTGAGVRAFDADGSAFACTDDVAAEGLFAAAEEAAAGFHSSANPGPVTPGDLEVCADLPADTLDRVSEAEAQALLRRGADAALSLMPEIDTVTVQLEGRSSRYVVFSSDGRFVRSARSTISLRVHLRGCAGREVHAVGGGKGGLGLFLTQRPEEVVQEAVGRLQALEKTRAGDTVKGEHAVVIAGGWGGVWLHEVVGHALESDVGRYGVDGIGERVAGDEITVVDDAGLAGGRGGGAVDDEGSVGKRSVLIDRGVLSELLTDRASAFRLGLPETGNGRRQNYRHEPLPRMSNLVLAPGAAAPEDLISAVGSGLYVKMIGGGRVVPLSDRFSFDVLEAYLIEHGRVGRPVRRLRLEGRPSEMLRRIAGIGNDFRLDPGRGSCEKKGQIVAVSVGMPTVLVDRITITPLE